MYWLGLLLPICFIPGYTGASIPTQWAVLSIVLPFLPVKGVHAPFTYLGVGFIAYALFSILWSINLYAWVWGMWLAAIWAYSFRLGAALGDLRPLWKGLALGLSVSTIVAVAQALDYVPVVTFDPYAYPGLLFNSSVAGVTLALVLIALASHRLWWYTPPLILGLILAGSRGSILLLAVAALARYTHWLVAIALLIASGSAYLYLGDLADSQRLMIWGITLPTLSPFGHGAGSYVDIFYIAKLKAQLFHPEYVHNDYLQLAFEFGLASLAILGILILALTRTASPDWPVLIAVATLACFYFPLYAPLTAFIGCVVAGHLTRDYVRPRRDLDRGRPGLIPWDSDYEPHFDPTWGEAIPLEPRA